MKKLILLWLTIFSATAFASGNQPSRVAVSELQAVRNEAGFPVITGIATNTSGEIAKRNICEIQFI